MFSYDSPTGAERWQAVLDRHFPPNNVISHLRIQWEPGEAWDELGRWFIYQMLPPESIPLIVLPWLDGPDPRSFARYDRIAGRVVYARGAPLISRRQWLIYRETGYYAMPYWVVQGERGGNKLRFNKAERLVARIKGYPPDPPAPGALPYAPIDERVINQLVKLDAMRTYSLLIDFALRNPDMVDEEEERGANEAKDRLWSWLEDQVGSIIEEAPYGTIERVGGLDAPVRIFT